MRTTVLSLGALALGLASAHEYPNCVSRICLSTYTVPSDTLTPDTGVGQLLPQLDRPSLR